MFSGLMEEVLTIAQTFLLLFSNWFHDQSPSSGCAITPVYVNPENYITLANASELVLAIYNGTTVTQVESLVSQGCDVNYSGTSLSRTWDRSVTPPRVTSYCSNYSPLLLAMYEDSEAPDQGQVVKKLLSLGADARTVNCEGTSAAMVAAASEFIDLEILQLLHKAGANLTAANEQQGSTVVSLLLHDSNEEKLERLVPMVKFVMDIGMFPYMGRALSKTIWGTPSKWHPVRRQILNMFIAYGVDLNGRDYRGRTAAYNAADYGNVAALRVLAEAGADLNLQPVYQGYSVKTYPPITRAITNFCSQVDDVKETVRFLLSTGRVDINRYSNDGQWPPLCFLWDLYCCKSWSTEFHHCKDFTLELEEAGAECKKRSRPNFK